MGELDKIQNEILAGTENVELIFLTGSHARGKMQTYSDIDLKVATRTKPRKTHIFRFVEHDGRKVLLTVHFKRLSEISKEFKDPNEWVWDYEAYTHAKVLFDRNQNMKKIKTELEKHKVSAKDFFKSVPSEASYLVEYVGKLKNAYLEKDELNVLYAAHEIAGICYNILLPFNPVWKYTSEKETYPSLIGLRNKPSHYVVDFKTCYGLMLKKRSIDRIFKSAIRIASETTGFLRKNLEKTGITDADFLDFFNSKEYKDFVRE